MELASISGNKLPLVFRALLFTLFWWLLTDGTANSWWLGFPAIVLSACLSIRLFPPMHLNWAEVVRFVPFYLTHSLIGGIDVARRAFHPRLPITPELVNHQLRLPPGLPQVLMINTISLLPGTLVVEQTRDRLKIHLLAGRKNFITEVDAVESRIARMFDVTMTKEK